MTESPPAPSIPNKTERPRIHTYPGPPTAVICVRLLVPFTAQNLLNEFLGQPERVLRDAATVGELVGVLEATLSDKLTGLKLVI